MSSIFVPLSSVVEDPEVVFQLADRLAGFVLLEKGLGADEETRKLVTEEKLNSEWDNISLEIQSFKICSSSIMYVNASSNSIKIDGLGEAPDGGRITVTKAVGGSMGCTTVNNSSDNFRGVVRKSIRETLIGNVDAAVQMHTINGTELVGLEVSETGPVLSKSLVELEL